MHTRPRLEHPTGLERPTKLGFLGHETLSASQTTLTSDQRVRASALGAATGVPRKNGGAGHPKSVVGIPSAQTAIASGPEFRSFVPCPHGQARCEANYEAFEKPSEAPTVPSVNDIENRQNPGRFLLEKPSNSTNPPEANNEILGVQAQRAIERWC